MRADIRNLKRVRVADIKLLREQSQRCRAIMAKYGVVYPPERRFARAYLYYFCDAVRLLAAVTFDGLVKPEGYPCIVVR